MSKYLNIIFGVVLLLTPNFFNGMEVKEKGFSNKLIEHIQSGNPKLLRAFLIYKKAANNLDIHAQNDIGWQALHYATEMGNLEMVNILVEFGASVNAKTQDARGRRPLHLAASTGNEKLFESLFRAGADSGLTDNLDLLPKHHAVNKEIMNLIVALAESTLRENKSSTQKRVDIADQFLTQEINSLPHYSFENTPGSPDLPNFVLPQKKDSNAQDSGKSTTLQSARQLLQGTIFDTIARGDVTDVKWFLDHGANIEAEYSDGDGYRPLICAVKTGHPEVVKLLIECGANIDAHDYNGYAALMVAAEEGRTEMVKLLIDLGANIDVHDKRGRTALLLAVLYLNGHTEIIKLLIAGGANIEAQAEGGCTALMSAAGGRHPETVKLLIESGANIEALDAVGNTPLMWAARGGILETVKLLIESGANAHAKNRYGQTAATIGANINCSLRGHEELVALLKK